MAEQLISLDGADGVSPRALNAIVGGRDPVIDVVAIIGPRTTLSIARDPETMLDPCGCFSRPTSSTRSLA